MDTFIEFFSDMRNSKITALLIFSSTFVVIILYVLTGKKRGERLESYKNIPFQDGEQNSETGEKK